MTNRELINKIKLLKQIKPDKDWKKSTRAFLLSRRSKAAPISNLNTPIKIKFLQPFRFRPMLTAALIIIFTITGCAYGLNISKTSLPGDMLWNVKLSLEKAQMTFSSVEQKVKLETDFAGKRLEELKTISIKEKPEAVAQVVENFQIHINEAKKRFKELDKETSQKATQETYAAITTAEDGYELWREELIEQIKQRIKDALKLAPSLEKEITQAETLLEEDRLIEALEKISEIEKIIKVK